MSHIKNLDVTHEASDVSVSGLLKFVVALTVMTVGVCADVGAVPLFQSQETEKEPKPGPMAMTRRNVCRRNRVCKRLRVWRETGGWAMGAA